MLLPKQSPPVERKTNVETKATPKAVRPQATCGCNQLTGTIWCLIGRNFYNTLQSCA